MRYRNIFFSLAAVAALTLTGCGGGGSSSSTSGGSTSGSSTSGGSTSGGTTSDTTLSGDISADKTLTADKTWYLDGKVNVTSGAKLTVEPGTTVAGKTPNSYLIIEPGSQIIAKGTKAQPIVFTSKKDADGQSQANATGEWGGLILAGNAHTHYGVNKYEADTSVTFGGSGHDHDTESSGDLEYVVIKHSGFEVEKDKELNGLSLAGVGSGTIIKNVAIIGGSDDGVEIWGGTVNIDGLYVYNAKDDSVDTDLGYRGTIQNVLVKQVLVDKTNNHDSSAMEFGNDENTITTDDTNATQPTIKNFTAYVKGGGFYNKFDAGFKWDNVKFISDKTTDFELLHFRGTDSYDSDAKHILSDVCLKDTAVTLTEDNAFSKSNSKEPKTEKTAYQFFVTDAATTWKSHADSLGIFRYDDDTSCAGANEANIWKGKAGSNDPLEQ